MWNWKVSHKYLLLDIAQVVQILNPNSVVQAFVEKDTGAVGVNALEYLIKRWLIPKHLVGQEKIEKEPV